MILYPAKVYTITQEKAATTLKGRLGKSMNGGVRGSALASAFGQSPHRLILGPWRAAAQAPATNGTSAGKCGQLWAHQCHLPTTLGTWGKGCPTAELRHSSWYGGHEKTWVKTCIRARSAQRVFPCMGNREGSFWAETKDKHLKSIHHTACVPEPCVHVLAHARDKKQGCVRICTPLTFA